ncbi:MAG: hypothetical protein EPN88_05005, partial [Bacteroidetes bacterium]
MRYIFEKKIYNVGIHNESRVTHEVADRCGILASMKRPQYLRYEFAKEFVQTEFNLGTDILRYELKNGEMRKRVLRELQVFLDKSRYETVCELIDREALDELLKYLRPTEIYYLGRRLFKSDL